MPDAFILEAPFNKMRDEVRPMSRDIFTIFLIKLFHR